MGNWKNSTWRRVMNSAAMEAKNLGTGKIEAEAPTPDTLQILKHGFLDIYEEITRPGSDKLLDWLENETDFFTAPAGSRHHGAHPGGLLVHSVNVWKRLRSIACRDILGDAHGHLPPETDESIAIMALLHDVCKAGVYHEETKRRKNPETNQWEDYQAYTFRDPFPLGHGEKSLYLISRFIDLTEAEALAIRWHMGAFDEAATGAGRTALNAAMDVTPWVWRLHEADMCAAHIDEREA